MTRTMNAFFLGRNRDLLRSLGFLRGVALAIAMVLSIVLSIPAQAAISFVAASAPVSSTGSNSIGLVVPTILNNDLLIAHVSIQRNGVITPPAGWTLIDQVYVSGNKVTQGIYYKLGLAADSGTTETWTFNASDDNAGIIVAYRGVDAATPIGNFSGNTGSSTNMTATSIATTVANEWLLAFYVAADGRSTPTSTPGGMSERYDFGNGGGNNGLSIAGDDEPRPTAGASGNRTSSSSLSDSYIAQLIALKPIGAATVVSIDRADADPTTAATVSWTVTFNTSMTGVSSGNFTLVNSGLGGAPAITSVSGGPYVWTITASTGTGDGTLGLNMSDSTGASPAPTNLPFTGQIYTVRPPTPVTYYLDTTNGVDIGFDGPTNVVSNSNQTIPPIITASLTLANTCNGNARSNRHPSGLYTHSRWYFTTDYAVDTDISANPAGSAYLVGRRNTDTVVVSLYDYDPVSGASALIGSSPAINLTGGGALTAYPYTINSSLYTVQAGHRLMLEYNFTQNGTSDNARVYCSAANSYLTVTELSVSPLAQYRMDQANWNGTAGEVLDASGNGNDAQAFNGASTDGATPAISGSPGTCRYGVFDNGGAINQGYVLTPLPDFTTDFTVAAWIRTTDNSVGGQRIFIDDDSNTGGYGFSLGDGAAGKLRVFSRAISLRNSRFRLYHREQHLVFRRRGNRHQQQHSHDLCVRCIRKPAR